MNKLKAVLLATTLIIITAGSSYAETAGVTLAKVAELGCHRLERLVTLGKIDENFLTKLSSLQVSRLTQTKPTDPAYKVIATQYVGADGSANQVDLFMDTTGKGIAQTIKTGTDAANAPVWNDKDAVSLIENSLHFVYEAASNDIKPFSTGLSTLTLKQITNAAGEKLARVEMLTSENSNLLEVSLREDGSIESTNVINQNN